MSRTFREIAETVITAAVIFVLLQTATQTFKVVGPSMNTTLADGQHLLVNKFVYETVESDVLADILPWVDPDLDGVQVAECRYERVLRQILSQCSVTHHAQRYSVNLVLVHLHKRVE